MVFVFNAPLSIRLPVVAMPQLVVAALYKFVDFEGFEAFRAPLLETCNQFHVKGTILLAPEGINGTIGGAREGIDSVLAFIRSNPLFHDLVHKESYTDEQPFNRMKVRLKKELITLGSVHPDPTKLVGTYIAPHDWNALISDPDVVLIDTRNDYEVATGTFEGAINPKTESFSEFPTYVQQNLSPEKHAKVAMFCTGGIRCEKATSFLLEEGFEHVYHLHGGILKYLEDVPEAESMWEGECFVFDHRVTVNHQLEPGSFTMCHACGHPLADTDRAAETFEEGVSCPHCYAEQTEARRAQLRERHRQVQLAAVRATRHIGS